MASPALNLTRAAMSQSTSRGCPNGPRSRPAVTRDLARCRAVQVGGGGRTSTAWRGMRALRPTRRGCRYSTALDHPGSTTSSPGRSASATRGTARFPATPWPNRLRDRGLRSADGAVGLWRRLRGARRLKSESEGPGLRRRRRSRASSTTRQWRWYSHDPATLAPSTGVTATSESRPRTTSPSSTRKDQPGLTEPRGAIVVDDSFLDDAATGELRRGVWIDPNFVDLQHLRHAGPRRPPALATSTPARSSCSTLYEASSGGPGWNETLL